MWELDHKENWMPKNWCFWTVVLEKILESPLSCKEIKPVNPKGNQSWTFIGRTDAEAEVPILWLPDAKNWLIRKDRNARKDWRQERGWQRMRCLDGITAQWTWVWARSGSWWWTGNPGVLQFMGSQRVGCDWATELKTLQETLLVSGPASQHLFHTICAPFFGFWVLLFPCSSAPTNPHRASSICGGCSPVGMEGQKHGGVTLSWSSANDCQGFGQERKFSHQVLRHDLGSRTALWEATLWGSFPEIA